MTSRNNFNLWLLIGAHLIFGFLFFMFPFLANFFTIVVVLMSIFWIVSTNNNNQQVLYASAYMVGVELLLRMLDANFLLDIGKYSLILYALLGIFFNGTKPQSIVFLVLIVLLIPGVFLGVKNLSHTVEIRKAIAFNISGPVCLAIFSLYTYKRMATLEQLKKILFFVILPLVTTAIIVILRAPTVREVVTGTASNFATSGGFGPNQVATMFGLGMFACFALFLLNQSSKKIAVLYLILTGVFAFRGLVTFSRGGMITGLVMILIFVIFLFKRLNQSGRLKILFISTFLVLFIGGVWMYTALQTDGLIAKRYANQDAAGRTKIDRLGGREQISIEEIKMFLDNPIWGVGVGVNKQYREQTTGIVAASHNEFTRMLAEHGLFGLISSILLLIIPFLNALETKQHIFLWCFYTFWLLTLNHAAIRLAAPAFLYALSLLNVQLFCAKEQPTN